MIFITSSISNQITQLFIKEHIFYTRHLFDGFFMYAIHEKSNIHFVALASPFILFEKTFII